MFLSAVQNLKLSAVKFPYFNSLVAFFVNETFSQTEQEALRGNFRVANHANDQTL